MHRPVPQARICRSKREAHHPHARRRHVAHERHAQRRACEACRVDRLAVQPRGESFRARRRPAPHDCAGARPSPDHRIQRARRRPAGRPHETVRGERSSNFARSRCGSPASGRDPEHCAQQLEWHRHLQRHPGGCAAARSLDPWFGAHGASA
eukprot:Amastigsp_a842457_66.p3 type:complete len:152 gc:universal Amastigsp_a842457_66:492-37(-)